MTGQCFGGVMETVKFYSNGDEEWEVRCGACGKLYDQGMKFSNKKTPMSEAIQSFVILNEEWHQWAYPLLGKSVMKKKFRQLTEQWNAEEAEAEKRKKELEVLEKKRKREQKERRRIAVTEILQKPQTCPHCGNKHTYTKADFLRSDWYRNPSVKCKKLRCRKVFVIEEILQLYQQ